MEGINTAPPPAESLRHEAPALQQLDLPLDPHRNQVTAALDAVAQSGRRPLLLARRAHIHAGQGSAIQEVVGNYPDALVVSMLEPFDLPLFSKARHLLAAYGDDIASIGGLADVLFGGSMPAGRLPVHVGGLG
ncbi:MAG: hypothetical protein JOY69_01925 [Candidatus Eremiobacteraeota bacterium]|nr:hypothetical protein [Candidatus Eremiobacteraeota bacterium]